MNATTELKGLPESWINLPDTPAKADALYKKAGTLDDEAPKKALTDAMTKAFSHLGVSADVFLGLFDNNKYVATMKEKFNGKATKDEGIKAKVVQINKNNKEKNNDK